MGVRITCISFNKDSDKKHKDVYFVGWENEKTSVSGKTSRKNMHDWIGIKGGRAYVIDKSNTKHFVGATFDEHGNKIIKCFSDGAWNDVLLSIPSCEN